MSIRTIRMERRTFYADAVRVTAENMAVVAEWCGGTIASTSEKNGSTEYIKIDMGKKKVPERQTRAYAGDWVMYAGRGYKSYSQKAMDLAFKPVDPAAMLLDIFTSA